MNESAVELAKHLLENIENKKKAYGGAEVAITHTRVIIDGFECDVTFYINSNSYGIDISAKSLTYKNGCRKVLFKEKFYCEKRNLSVECISNELQILKELLSPLKVDKRKGRIVTENYYKHQSNKRKFLGNLHSENNLEKCYVCLEESITKTPCKHTLCFVCAE